MDKNFRPHLFLSNPRGEKRSFDASRGYVPQSINQKPASSYQRQKVTLHDDLKSFQKNREARIEKRTLDVPAHLEFIQIDFFVVFNNNDAFKNRLKFKNRFGLIPVVYSNFNQTVLFAINDTEKFEEFVKLLEQFINSSEKQHPSGTDYSIITIIQAFQFISTKRILANDLGEDVLVSLINPSEEIGQNFTAILQSLITFLQIQEKDRIIINYSLADNTIIQIKGISKERVEEIANNFDIIYNIQSIRVPTIRPNIYNQPELTWALEINPPSDRKIKIGILDNGIKQIPPLNNIIMDYGFDITGNPPNALTATSPHGTVVASLAALGLDFFNTEKTAFTSDAWIVPMKILNFNIGYFNPNDIEDLIKQAYKQGIKIFNLSVCGPCKNYNSSISEFSFFLDRLAFKYDILIFIATGNLGFDDIEAMQNEANTEGLHTYPNHFYNPNKSSSAHTCEATNICIPAESMNNITVGAIADNCNNASNSDLTPFKEFPAFYTRKHYLDYLRKVNGTLFSNSQKNVHINKPDIVMPGGDVLNSSSAMHVLGFGLEGNDFYYKDAGTSLATPLAANLAAKLLKLYPKLNMQSIKCLILNSAVPLLSDEFLDDIVEEIKKEEEQKIYGKDFEDLERNEKTYLNKNINSRDLYKKIVGFGMPVIEKALYSSEKSVTLVIQDSLFSDSFKVVNINIPEYLLLYSKTSHILDVKATLCYKFSPVFNNHLGYNPLHISFNFINSVVKDNPSRIAEIISNRHDGFFDALYQQYDDDKTKLKARNKALGVKSEMQPWSEDFYPRSNKPFCNSQTLELKINKSEIEKINNQISLVVRCTCKTDYEQNLVDWLKINSHEFSIAVIISEKPNDELLGFDLLNELENCNDLNQIVTLQAEGEGEAVLTAEI